MFDPAQTAALCPPEARRALRLTGPQQGAVNALATCTARRLPWRRNFIVNSRTEPGRISDRVMRALIEYRLTVITVTSVNGVEIEVATLTAKGRAKVNADQRRMRRHLVNHKDKLPPAKLWLKLRWDARISP